MALISGGGGGGTTFNGGTITAPLVITDPATGDTGLTINIPAGATADPFVVTNAGGTAYTHISKDGGLDVNRTDFSEVLLVADGSNVISAYTPTGTNALVLTNAGAIKHQTNSFVLAAGHPVVTMGVAPTDGALAANQAAFWYDNTNGAAKLMLKGKTADGTVVSASIALA